MTQKHRALRRALLRAASPAAIMLGLLAAAPAFAQTAPVNLDLGAVLATGTGDTAALATTPGTAPYEAPSLTPLNSTQPTSVVSQQTIQQQLIGTQSYADAARLTPSVNVIEPNGPGLMESTGPTIRGFQDGQYNVTYDGIPIGDSNDFTHHTTSFFTNSEIGQTIVDRGPGTAETVGDATFGGTVSVRTIAPAPTATATPYGEYGSYNTSQEGLRIDSGAVQSADGAQAVFNVEHLKSDGALSNSGQERSNFFGKVVVPVGDNTVITFLADYNKLYQNPAIGATLAQMAAYGPDYAYNKDPNSQNYNRYNNDHITTDMEYVDVESHLPSNIQYDGKIYTYAYYHEDLNGDDVNDSPSAQIPNLVDLTPAAAVASAAAGVGGSVVGVPGQVFKNDYRSVGTIQRAEDDFNWGDIKVGFWADHQVNTRFVQNVDLTGNNAINYSFSDSNGGQITSTNDFGSIERLQHNQLYTFQPYLQGDWKPIDGLTLTGGFKYAYFRRALDGIVQQKTELLTGYTHDWGRFLPSAEARYALSPNLSVYAQVAEGFLAPNLNTFYTKAIATNAYAPEQTWNYQTGLAYQDAHLALGADAYLVHFTNFINSKGSGQNKIFFNQGGVVYKGLEGDATYTFDTGFSFFGNAGLNKATQTGNNSFISGAPAYTANAGIIYDKNGIYWSVIDELTGGEFGGAPALGPNPRDPGQYYDPYNIVNLSMGYTFNALSPHLKHVSVKLNIDNLTDQSQIFYDNGTNNAGDPLYFRLTGTSAFVTVAVPLSF